MLRVLSRVIGAFRFIGAYTLANVQAAMEYRVAFITEIAVMVSSDSLWLLFWLSYFQQFSIAHNWNSREILLLWTICTVGFGISMGVFGNAVNLSRLIMNGSLDAYLSMPRNVLLHACVSASDPGGWGDMLFGLGGFLLFVHPDPLQMVLYGILVCCSAVVFTAFLVIIGSLTFFLGNLEGMAQQLLGVLVSFSTYPQEIFRGGVLLLLFTVLPSGFIAYLPMQALQQHSWLLTGEVVAFTLFFGTIAYLLFSLGLRRYESGNLLGMQS
ncbi:MAG TPA: ABC-2 family transporter protein [Ktedonobacteraceae bacterium]|nr:ABC-2 family transporter protein [Ktedonobacteraceae bacterium]